ncbi:M56 family metallopeptidase [Mesoterricola silvestris]|uniref:TonB C-terminal domain-containing protein n=1 Tax=Mesoterricola silvestris TaxID=2927979 RepID=A0AA48GQY5_9BACT|nr:M56 family metallopeptidase [Mesoterricola silvestris]BDU72600.1 hypothetical protein METEAL_17740 [Mesoterricola silvestris]
MIPILDRLGLALFHSLWEVSVLGLAAWGGLLLLRRRPAETRYAFACGMLGAMVALPAATFLLSAPGAPSEALAGAVRQVAMEGQGVRAATPWLALAWVLGASLMTLRLGGGLWWLERAFVKPSRPAPEAWAEAAAKLASRMGVHRPLALRVGTRGDSPLVIGFFRPVILVPAAAFLNLDSAALEAVLAHEIAHVRRGDYLANALQSAAEALLFFHPAAWWLSGHVRELREHCCDDAAAEACGDPLALAQGLASLERLRRTLPIEPDPACALGAAKGNLMPRITRLFTPRDASVPSFRGLALMVGAAALAGAFVLACRAPRTRPLADVDFSQVKIAHQPAAPAYPPEAKIARIQGTVEVRVTIDEQGVPIAVEAVSGPEELRPTAVDYAKGWTFAPLLRDGKPVKARFLITMPFRLR